ncbi:hypothetical protein [Microcoleus sp.]|uniref:hypothetical protein n=1 Tax=Microcoleus sp. TaxID=44472 RepID=UPI0035247FF4
MKSRLFRFLATCLIIFNLLISFQEFALAVEEQPYLREVELRELKKVEVYPDGRVDLIDLTEQEISRFRKLQASANESGSTTEDLLKGRCINNTSYKTVMYYPGVWQGKDNTPLAQPPGTISPNGIDCDGMFVPRNVTAQGIQGPFAAKIRDPQTLEMTGDRYSRQFPGGSGFEILRNGDVNWWIGNVTQEDVESWGG